MDADHLPLHHLLPLRSVVVTLRFLDISTPAFFHQPALAAFLRFLADSPKGFESFIRFDTPETGCVRYQAGDHYRFTLMALAGGEAILQTLLAGLAGLPHSSPKTDPAMPFRNNCVLVALHDAFTAQPVQNFEALSAYGAETLQQEAALWQAYSEFDWQFLAPTRWLKAKQQRGTAKGEARYCRNLVDVDGALLSARLYDSLAELLRTRHIATPPRQPAPAFSLGAGHVFWQDAAYTDAEANKHPIGGMTGRLSLRFAEPAPLTWLQAAILGQYTGLGQRAAFGLGRYRLESPDGSFSYRRALPAASLPVLARHETPAPLGSMDALAQLLCVTGKPATLSTHEARLRIERDGETLHDLPWHHLQAVILFGTHTLTTPALHAALKHAVPLHFAGTMGGYRGVLWTGQPAEPGCGLWLKQTNLFADPALCLVLAQTIVSARVRHLRETLRLRGETEAAEQLNPLLDRIQTATDLTSLNGLEGAATRAFFQGIANLLPAAWGFNGRNRQQPKDPINALLSFGYTLLNGYVETLLHVDGLLPWLGFYHQAHGQHATLASDLMEPFRHLVERTVLSAIQRHELTPQDFFTAANGGCLMQNEARRRFLSSLLERFNTPLTAHGEEQALTPVQHIHRQNRSLIRWLNQGEAFQAFRTR